VNYLHVPLKRKPTVSRKPQIFAHRGAKTVAPENTLPAFQKALDLGVDGVELDVQCTRDGRMVVIHDFDVDHTTDGSGKVAAFTYDEIRRLDAGRHFSEAFTGTPIPTLEDVFDLIDDRCQVNVEIKSTAPDGGKEVEAVVRLIQQRRLHDQVIVSSFNPITLIAMRWHDPKIPLGLLYAQPLPVFLRRAWLGPFIAPEALHPHHKMIDAAYMQWAHSRGHYVNTWTVNDVAEAQRLADLGVDVIMTDVPDEIIAGLV
jgi:glycerophosphoryl diester phosphodiesterase